ncbi:protein STABILIZED1 [Cryptosporidium felis]|nr:protein STABILIZED1 [Cryptosporidium felis]
MNNQYIFPLGLNPSKLQGSNKQSIFGEPPPDYVPGKGRGAVGFASGVSRDDQTITIETDIGDYSDSRFDKFAGFNDVLFKDVKYDEEDKKADSIYEMIEEKLSNKRKAQKEKKLREAILKDRERRPTLQEQFSDLKQSLGNVKLEEWDRIPEQGEYFHKSKKLKQFTPVPDNAFHSINETNGGTSLNSQDYFFSDSKPNPKYIQLNELGTAKGNVLSIKLDKAMDNVSGQSVIDSSVYLDSLSTMDFKVNNDISDVKKARLLLKSVVNTNPKHAPGWIAATRFEEVIGRLSSAREIIAQGCEMCSKNEDIWIEAIRIGKQEEIDKIIVKALKFIPDSVKIWMIAANKETNKNKKLLILKKALEFVPNSIKLWKEAISLVGQDSERNLLTKAVKCVPKSEEFWLRLANLSDYLEAQKILNQARKELPTNPEIWVAAAKLEEENKKADKIDLIITRCISSLSAKRFVHSREEWLSRAGGCEKDGYPNTCISIIRNTWLFGLNDESIKNQVYSDIDNFIENGCLISARTLFEASIEKLRLKKSFWIKWATFEEKYGDFEKVDGVLQESLKSCSDKQILWIKAANNQSKNGNFGAARLILSKGYSSGLSEKEDIVLAAVKLELSQGEIERARIILMRERANSPTVKIWIESIQLERKQKNLELCIEYCTESVKKYPDSSILWLLYGSVHYELYPNKVSETIKIYERGLTHCNNSIELWLSMVDLLIVEQNWKKARTVLDLARSNNKNNPELWMHTIKLEKKAGNSQFIGQILSKALKECPKSGMLHAESIFSEPKVGQKSKSVLALEQCGDEPYVLVAIAILFWKEKDFSKSRKWFKNAIEIDSKIGDSWMHYIAFEIFNGDYQSQKDVFREFCIADPNKGFEWDNAIRANYLQDITCSKLLTICLENCYGINGHSNLTNEIKELLGLA